MTTRAIIMRAAIIAVAMAAVFVIGVIISTQLDDAESGGQNIIEKHLQAAKSGDSAAQFAVAEAYYRARHIGENKAEAMYWLEEAAKNNYTEAQNSLAARYYKGDIVGRDLEQAFKWYSESAEQGNAEGQYALASMYGQGDGVAQNEELAYQWAEKSAAQGNMHSQYVLGLKARKNNDDKQAVWWLGKSAEQGYCDAQWLLSGYYYAGKGVDKNIPKSKELLLQAATTSVAAQYWLGVLHLHEDNDMGIEKDEARGLALVHGAAQKGVPEARDFLDKICKDGEYADAAKNICAAAEAEAN